MKPTKISLSEKNFQFKFIDSNNFWINTFGIGPIDRALYMSGLGGQGQANKIARPLIYRALSMGLMQKL